MRIEGEDAAHLGLVVLPKLEEDACLQVLPALLAVEAHAAITVEVTQPP